MAVTLNQAAKRRRQRSLYKAFTFTVMTKAQRRVCRIRSPNYISCCTMEPHVVYENSTDVAENIKLGLARFANTIAFGTA